MTVHYDPSGKGWFRYVPFKEFVAYPQHAFFNARGRPVKRLAGYPA